MIKFLQSLFSQLQSYPRFVRYAIYWSILALGGPVGYVMLFTYFKTSSFWWEFTYIFISSQLIMVTLGALIGKKADQLKSIEHKLQSSLKETTKALEQKQNQLLHSTRLASIGELASSLAHEMRQPLTIITGYCEEVLMEYEKELKPDVVEMIKRILEQGQYMAALSSDLRDFARKETAEMLSISINTLLEKTVGFYQPQLEKRGIKINRELTPDLPSILGDPIQIQQVLVNLINNALDALESCEYDGVITLCSMLDKEHHLIVQVKDNGPTIPDNIREKILTPFFTSKPIGKGTGLGLNISQSIMEKHGGILRLEATPTTTFTLVFPVLVTPLSPELRFKGRVLVIDDNPDIRTILSKKLARLGLVIDQSPDFKSAIAMIDENEYDLIFSDFNLGGKHGGHVLRHLRESYPGTPFYFISRYFSMMRLDLQNKMLSLSNGWVEKPFSDQKLLEILERHLPADPRDTQVGTE